MAICTISRASIGLSAAAAAVLSFPGAASAQAVPESASSLLLSKSEAILGAPSALQAILAQQGAPARSAPIAPASYSAPRAIQAVARSGDEGVHSGELTMFIQEEFPGSEEPAGILKLQTKNNNDDKPPGFKDLPY